MIILNYSDCTEFVRRRTRCNIYLSDSIQGCQCLCAKRSQKNDRVRCYFPDIYFPAKALDWWLLYSSHIQKREASSAHSASTHVHFLRSEFSRGAFVYDEGSLHVTSWVFGWLGFSFHVFQDGDIFFLNTAVHIWNRSRIKQEVRYD